MKPADLINLANNGHGAKQAVLDVVLLPLRDLHRRNALCYREVDSGLRAELKQENTAYRAAMKTLVCRIRSGAATN